MAKFSGLLIIRDYGKLYKQVTTVFNDPVTSDLFQAIETVIDTISSPLAIVRGDTADPGADTAEKCAEIVSDLTYIAAVWMYLAQLSTGPDGGLRYAKRTGDHCFGGYHVEDWFRGFHHLIFFIERRRGRNVLDGKSGPRNSGSLDPFVFSASESNRLLEEGDKEVAENTLVKRAITYQMGSEVVRASTHARSLLAKPAKAQAWFHNRTRFLAALTPFDILQDRQLRGGNSTPYVVAHEHIAPLDSATLELITTAMYKHYGVAEEPAVRYVDPKIVEALPHLFGEQKDVLDFMSTQQGLIEEQVREKQKPDETTEACRARITQEVKASYAMLRMTASSHPFASTDSDADLLIESLKLAGKYNDQLPDTGPDMTGQPVDPKVYLKQYSWGDWFTGGLSKNFFLPHQLIDSYILHKLELSPIAGFLLANTVGTGKTLIYGRAMELGACRLDAAVARGEAIECGPNLVMVPAALVYQTFTELRNNFPSFDIYVRYGSVVANASTPGLQTATLNDDD